MVPESRLSFLSCSGCARAGDNAQMCRTGGIIPGPVLGTCVLDQEEPPSCHLRKIIFFFKQILTHTSFKMYAT